MLKFCITALSFVAIAANAMAKEPTELIEQPVIKPLDPVLHQALGKLIFHDTSLSQPKGQSCASCHQPEHGFADPQQMTSAAADPKLTSARNTPSISYIKHNPVLHWDNEEKHWVGGFFYDGRATNLKQQALMPLFNPLEMANKSEAQLVAKLKQAPYVALFSQLYGQPVLQQQDLLLDAVADALVAYQQGPEFALFNSKFDGYKQGKLQLSEQELLGLQLFEAEDKGNCAACHPTTATVRSAALFTDFTYDNLGLAANPQLKFVQLGKQYNPAGKDFVDLGLAQNPYIHDAADQRGKFKVPSLRNVAITAPYMHNGMFSTLQQVVEFYNSRDVDQQWGVAEVTDNVNKEELGDLKLTQDEVAAIVAFMNTLTDNYDIKNNSKN